MVLFDLYLYTQSNLKKNTKNTEGRMQMMDTSISLKYFHTIINITMRIE